MDHWSAAGDAGVFTHLQRLGDRRRPEERQPRHQTSADGRGIGSSARSLPGARRPAEDGAIITDDDVDPRNGVRLSTGPDGYQRIPRIDIVARTRRIDSPPRFRIREAPRLLSAPAVGAPSVSIRHRSCPTPTPRCGWASSRRIRSRRSAETRGVQGLFVADNSVLANASGVPTRRSPRRRSPPAPPRGSFQKYFGGAPWVAHEHPTASTDHHVTAAVRQRRL